MINYSEWEPLELLSELVEQNGSKLLLIVSDGLGDVPTPPYNKTPLEFANTPWLDSIAADSALGATDPVFKGITPGSGPGHMALFGYNPIKWEIKRGILEVLGMDMEVREGDVAFRGNFATVEERDGKLVVVDRRAGRIPTSLNQKLIGMISERLKEIDGVKVILKSGIEHRFAMILRGEGLSDMVADTDPGHLAPPLPPTPLEETPAAKRTAEILRKFVNAVAEILKEQKPANYVLLRGASTVPKLPKFPEVYRLRAGAIATYPMYRGIAKLLGFDEIPLDGNTWEDEIKALEMAFKDFDFIYLHFKDTDKAGEDGNFLAKVKAIERLDAAIPRVLNLKPDVMVVTGDHSTPCIYKAHGFQPVPYLLKAQGVFGGYKAFNERECFKGELGIFPAMFNMSLMLAYGRRLKKFRA